MKSLASDPFRERSGQSQVRRLRLLGADFRFSADDGRLLDIVDSAFAGLPPLRFPHSPVELDVRLQLQAGGRPRGEPPMAQYSSGAGLLCGTMDAHNFAIVDSAGRRAYVAIGEPMLRSTYHARYELLEFAAMTLAARTQNLVPLHGACIASRGRGVLLLGESGAGKSTLCLHGLLDGFELISEDSVFIEPATLRAVGLANFLHLRSGSTRFLRAKSLVRSIHESPTIRRRSGVRKVELDVRQSPLRAAQRTPRIVATVFVAARRGRNGAELMRLNAPGFGARLARDQPYATEQKGWPAFVAAARGNAYELRRGEQPQDSVRLLRKLLGDVA
jgi:hypothetical protein